MKLGLKLRLPGKKGAIIIGVAVLLMGGTAAGLWLFGPRGGIIHFAMEKVGLAAPLSEEATLTEKEKIDKADEADNASELSDAEIAASSDLIRDVRQMQREMTAMSVGDAQAGQRFKKAMLDMRTMLNGPTRAKLDPAVVDALVIYLLSGGNPTLVAKATAETEISTRRRALLAAAMAYVGDKPKVAADKVDALDPAAFPSPIAARLYMMRAQLHDDAPYEERRANLVNAAQHALGTLVEEAATRRLVALAAKNLKLDDFIYWANRYQRRFPKSLYFADFGTDFVKGIAALEKNKTPVGDSDLELLAAGLPENRKVGVLGDLQTAALRGGHKRLCGFAYDKIVRIAAEGSEDMSRAKLYNTACKVGEDDVVLEELGTYKPSNFSMEDVEVLKAASSLANGIARQDHQPFPQVYGPQQPYEDFEAVKTLDASVAQQLDATNKALEGLSQ